MDHPRCATCSHWVEEEHGPWDAPKWFKLCRATPHLEDLNQWNPDRKVREIKPEHAQVTMAAMDASSYRADLFTRADNYCPMHSELKAREQ
jgi:hypothetical protein